MEIFILLFVLALIPAAIASAKGRSFMLWWFYGVMLLIVALPMAIFMKPLNKESTAGMRKCPKCAEYVQAEAQICKHCKSELIPLTDNEEKQLIKEEKTKDYIPGWLVLITFVCFGFFIWFMASS